MWTVVVYNEQPQGYAVKDSEGEVIAIFGNEIQTQNVVEAHNKAILKIQDNLTSNRE